MKGIIIVSMMLWLATVIGTSTNPPTPCNTKTWCSKGVK